MIYALDARGWLNPPNAVDTITIRLRFDARFTAF